MRGRPAEAIVTGEVPLPGAGAVRAIARRLGVQPTTTLAQNFVVQPCTVRPIAASAGPCGGDDVLREAGPGRAPLALARVEAGARAGARVGAVGLDPVLAAELPAPIVGGAPAHASRVTVGQADALRIGNCAIPAP